MIPAEIYEEENKVYIRKMCPDHGSYSDIYWGDYDEYIRAQSYDANGKKLENPQTVRVKGCQYDCGICTEHKSHTVLAIIDITNRCNLRCPICFAHAGAAGYIYEPTKDEIRGMLKNLMANRPVPPPALQFSGGEPTVRDDLPELVKIARELGFLHVEVNSNGIRMAESVDYCKSLKEAGVSTIYLQFDGVTPRPYKVARGRARESLLQSVKNANDTFESGNKTRAKASAVAGVMKSAKLGTLKKYLLPVLKSGTYDSLSDLHHNMIMIGSMHFMDPYNFDLERVQRCVIHYATPDGRLIPFCTMNNIHRAEVEKKFSKPLDSAVNTPLYDVESLINKINEEKHG